MDPLESGNLPATDGQPAVVVALPERAGELQLVRDQYPGGSIVDFHRPGHNELLFSVYELPAGAGGR